MTKTILKRFEAQRSRGTTSFGFYLPEKDKLVHNIKETRIKTLLKRTRGENQEVLFHHRLSTSTADVRNACHPFSTKDTFDYEYIGVHNGMVSNSYLLKSDHEELGIKYVSTQPPEGSSMIKKFNDSEALIYDLARYFEGHVDKLKAYGTIAFIVIRMDRTGKARKLFFGTNRQSLVMKRTKNSLVVSSEGAGEAVPNNVLHMYDYDTNELTTQPMEIPASYSYNRSGSTYSHSHTNQRVPETSSHANDVDDEEFNRRWADSYNSEKYARGYTGNSAGTSADEPEEGNLTKAERDDLMKTLNDLDSDDTKEGIEEYYGQLGNDEFVVLVGTKRELKKRLLSVSGNKHHQAIVECRKKLDEVGEELDRLNAMEVPEEVDEEFLEYYALVSEYSMALDSINKELKAEAQSIEDSKEARSDRVMGFQIPQTSLSTQQKQLAA